MCLFRRRERKTNVDRIFALHAIYWERRITLIYCCWTYHLNSLTQKSRFNFLKVLKLTTIILKTTSIETTNNILWKSQPWCLHEKRKPWNFSLNITLWFRFFSRNWKQPWNWNYQIIEANFLSFRSYSEYRLY